jgi:spore coat protein YutH
MDMLEKFIYEQYKLYCEVRSKIGSYETFVANGQNYFIAEVEPYSDDDFRKLNEIAFYMNSQGESALAKIVPMTSGAHYFNKDGQRYALFQLPKQSNRTNVNHLGLSLASFHKRTIGYQFTDSSFNHYMKWKSFWERRLQQLEAWYEEMKKSNDLQSMDREFVETFPYFLGVTENAIQYLTDIELDEGKEAFQQASICHQRFTDSTWQTEEYVIKKPSDWVVDQPTRDLAEYIRNDIFVNEGLMSPNSNKLLNEYEREYPLSKSAWRFLYGRLLFPSNYYTIIEGYYSSESNNSKQEFKNQFKQLIGSVSSHEKFLSNFYHDIGLPSERLQIPVIDWLKK